jgi:hypothetical protein
LRRRRGETSNKIMTRSDGKFPVYKKLKVDPKRPPEGWRDNGARRCLACGKGWPNMPIFAPSPCCGQQAGIVVDANPDVTWPEAVHALLQARFERFYQQWNEDATDEDLLYSEEEIEKSLDEIQEHANMATSRPPRRN